MKINLLFSADEMTNFQSTIRYFWMYLTKATLHLRSACLFPRQLDLWFPQKCSFVSRCLQPYPSHCNVIAKKYISMSATPSIRIYSGSLFLIPKPLQQMLPFHIRAGKIHTNMHTHRSHCTANTITFSAGLQMPLGLQATNHTFLFVFFFLSLSQEWLFEGVHTHDMRAEADVHPWIRMSQDMPTEMSQNTRKTYLMIRVWCVFYTVITPNNWPSWVSTTQTPRHGLFCYRKVKMRHYPHFNSWSSMNTSWCDAGFVGGH